MNLAQEIVARFYGEKSAEEAALEFTKVFSNKELPTDIPQSCFSGTHLLVDLLSQCGGFKSRTQIKNLITQGAVRINSQKVMNIGHRLEEPGEYIVQAGKHWYNRIILS